MATWSTVARIVAALPDTSEGKTREGRRSWSVKDRVLAWERPLRKSDLAHLGDAAPEGDVLSVAVGDLMTKDAILQSAVDALFTTPHFNGYPAVLVELAAIRAPELRALLREAWSAVSALPEKKKKRSKAPAKPTARAKKASGNR